MRVEQPAGIDDEVMRAPFRVDEESVDLAKLIAGGVLDLVVGVSGELDD